MKIISRTTVKETGCICLKIKPVEEQKERPAWRGIILEKLRVAEMFNEISHFSGT
jgi:hypothetical protein